ncbi:MAG: hypothetical protein IBX62_00865 [Coriobacteriia bacterium]|nr:hypothetical protein [Coriobacteriia bacterium]
MYGHLKDRRMRTRIASVVVLAMLLGLLASGAAMAELDEAVEEPAAEAPSANEAPAEEAAEPEDPADEGVETDEDAGAEALTINPMQTNETPPTPMVRTHDRAA